MNLDPLQGGGIAELIYRFRHSPPAPADSRPKPRLWWLDDLSAPPPRGHDVGTLLDHSRSADAAVDAALHAATAASGEGGGDVIARALAVIRESRKLYEAGVLRENPHVKLVNARQRGYLVFDVTPAGVDARLRVVDEKKRDSGVATAAQVRVQAGRPGVEVAG